MSSSKFENNGKCLFELSSNEEIFNESVPLREDKLDQSGYQQKLGYNPVNTKTYNKRNYKRYTT